MVSSHKGTTSSKEVGVPQTDGQTDRQTDRQTDKQIDRQTDRQVGRETDKQTGAHIFHLTVIHKELGYH